MADEPLFMLLDEKDPEYQATVRAARESLDELRHLIARREDTRAMVCVKTTLVDGEASAPMWLTAAEPSGTGFTAMVFEIPPELPSIEVGQWIEVPETELLDWMVNDGGVLHGGFSLRYQRARVPDERRAWFDEYVGVKRYASLGLAAKEHTAGQYQELLAATPERTSFTDVAPMDLKDPVMPVFIPALVVLLVNLEKEKRAPLSEAEVLAIRDKGVCMTMRRSMARALAESRGYEDIDPDNVWNEWQRVRAELVREPGADDGE